jgi:transposase
MDANERNKSKVKRRTEMIRLRNKGLSNREIAGELGTSERAVATILYRAKQEGFDVPPPPYWSRGS